MAEGSRQFEGTRDGDSIRVTPAKPIGERNMVKFNRENPVHMELIRSLGDSAPHSSNTMKGENVMLHPGGYFSTPKGSEKNQSEVSSEKAVAKPKRAYNKKTVSASKSRPQGTGHKRTAPAPTKAPVSSGKGKGGVWADVEARIKATAAETESKSKKGKKKQ